MQKRGGIHKDFLKNYKLKREKKASKMIQTQTKNLTPPSLELGLIFTSQKTDKDGSSQRMNYSELYKFIMLSLSVAQNV